MKKLIYTFAATLFITSTGFANGSLEFTFKVSTSALIADLLEISSQNISIETSSPEEKKRRDKRKRLEESIEVYNSTKEITPDLKEHISVIRRDADDNQFKDIQEMTDAQLAYAINEALKYQPEGGSTI